MTLPRLDLAELRPAARLELGRPPTRQMVPRGSQSGGEWNISLFWGSSSLRMLLVAVFASLAPIFTRPPAHSNPSKFARICVTQSNVFLIVVAQDFWGVCLVAPEAGADAPNPGAGPLMFRSPARRRVHPNDEKNLQTLRSLTRPDKLPRPRLGRQ